MLRRVRDLCHCSEGGADVLVWRNEGAQAAWEGLGRTVQRAIENWYLGMKHMEKMARFL